jgi:hypothetical protein
VQAQGHGWALVRSLDDALGALADHGFTTRVAAPSAEARAMSHEATNWAIKQRGLKPTTKIVLWHLCDRFNPDYGCFPSQDRLAEDCEISRSTLNEHLGQLEAAGLLRRVPRLNPVTKRQMPTRYILGFEPGFTPHVPARVRKPDMETPDDGETCAEPAPFDGNTVADLPRAVSGNRTRVCADPCPILTPTRVRKMPKAVSGIRTLTL